MPPVIDEEKCNGCGLCEEMCPGDVIFSAAKGAVREVRYPDECWHCGVCRMECPKEAVNIIFPFKWLL